MRRLAGFLLVVLLSNSVLLAQNEQKRCLSNKCNKLNRNNARKSVRGENCSARKRTSSPRCSVAVKEPYPLDEETSKYLREIIGEKPVNVSSPRPDDRSNSVKPSNTSDQNFSPPHDDQSKSVKPSNSSDTSDQNVSPPHDDQSKSVKPSNSSEPYPLDEETSKYLREIIGEKPVNVSSPRPDDRSNSVKPSNTSDQNVSPLHDDQSKSVKPSNSSGHKKCITAEDEYGICVHKFKCNFQNNVNNTVFCAQGLVCCSISYVNETNSEAAPHSEKCGRSNSEHSFNNGSAQYGEFPWMVALIKNSWNPTRWPYEGYIGGGTIIHPYVVITTAVKVSGFSPQKSSGIFRDDGKRLDGLILIPWERGKALVWDATCVDTLAASHLTGPSVRAGVALEAAEVKCRAGEWNIHSEVEISPPQERELSKIIIHEQFSNVHQINNIAMLVLKKPFQFGDNIGYACLDYQLSPPGKMTQCFSMGWGQERTGQFSDLLKKVKVRYIEFEKCQEMLRGMDIIGGFKLHPSHLCATGVGEEDVYIGDGGSPLACRNEDTSRYTVYGMVILGLSSIGGTPPSKPPSVYVNVANLHLWIDKEMEKEGLLGAFSRKNEGKK